MPVVCPECGQPIPATDAVVCPSCGHAVPSKRPLSLDDAVQLPPRRGVPWRKLVLLAVVSVLVGIGAFLASRYGPGLLDGGLREFAPPDGGFAVKLPGDPVAEPDAANPMSPVTLGGQRYVARRWDGSLSALVGWQNLDPERAKLTRADDAIAAKVRRRSAELNGTILQEAAVKFGPHDGREVRDETPNGPWVERYIYVAEGRPRLYFVGVGGLKVDPDGPIARAVLDSFKLL